jgi:hypothetical protein
MLGKFIAGDFIAIAGERRRLSWLNVPAGFLAFILESDYLKFFNFCCFSQFNIVYSNIYGVYTIAMP